MSRKKTQISDLNLNKISDRIVYIRLKAGKKQDEFAKLIGISKTTASNIENLRHEPSYSALKNISQLFGVNTKWLLFGEGDPYIYKDREGGDQAANEPLYNKDSHLDEDPVVSELLQGARKVLKSGNRVAFDALERNIKYFSHAVNIEKELTDLRQDVKTIKEYIKARDQDKKAALPEPADGELTEKKVM